MSRMSLDPQSPHYAGSHGNQFPDTDKLKKCARRGEYIPTEEWEDFTEEERRRFDLEAAGREVAPRRRVITLADLWADETLMRPPPVVVPYIAWEGRVSLLAAREKVGKSTLCGAGVAALSQGRHFLGASTTKGHALYVGLEEHLGDLGRRLRVMDADPELVFVTHELEKAMDDIEALAAELAPAWMVLDSLAELAGWEGVKDQGQASSWVDLMHRLKMIARRTGAALTVVHHMNKLGTYRDSTHIGAAVDAVLEMAPDEADPTKRVVKARGRIPVEGFEYTWTEGEPPRLAGDTVPLHVRVLSFIRNSPGSSKRAVANGVVGRHTDTFKAIDALIGRGMVVDEGASGGASRLVLATPPGSGSGSGWEHHA